MDAAKTALYDRLKIQEPGPGYCHFPIGRDEEYFDQLTAEKKYTRYHHGYPKQEWRKPATARNEARDCRVYAYAALHPLYASGLKLTVYCERFAQMGRSRRKEMQSIPPSVVVAQAEHLQVQNGNGFADDARQIQLHGALNLLVFAFGDMLADGFSRTFHGFGGDIQPGKQFHRLTAMIKRCGLAYHRQHAPHARKKLRVFDVQFGVNGELALVAVPTPVVRP